MFKIVKNLPLPEEKKVASAKGRSSIYPFGNMEIGDCMKFDAESVKDVKFKKVYNSAMGFARRHGVDYRFSFAEIKPGVYGCWKLKLDPGEQKERRRKRRTNAELMSIRYEDIMDAMNKSGSTAGAAKMVGLTPRTFSRLKEMYEKGLLKK